MKYLNPWATNGAHFVDLGTDSIRIGSEVREFDFYALPEPGYISFGARYSNEPSCYVSGFASRGASDGLWEIVGDLPVHVAAARYFANHRE